MAVFSLHSEVCSNITLSESPLKIIFPKIVTLYPTSPLVLLLCAIFFSQHFVIFRRIVVLLDYWFFGLSSPTQNESSVTERT